MLSVKGVGCSIAGKTILEDVTFQILGKQHIGLVGRNGSGKSTLFKVINGIIEPDSGSVSIEQGCRILSVKQQMPSGEMTPREFLLSEYTERNELMAKLEDPSTDPEEICHVYDRLISINAFEAEAKAAVVLKGLGFSEDDQNQPLNTFSGGWRMRIALGAVLFQEPDLLLLDEPTNHLDLETTDWLQSFLQKYPGSFILISHDRDFLNETVDHILHLKANHITKYKGNFDTFLDTYTMKQKNAAAFNAKQEEKRKHMLKFVERFGAKATKAKQAQSRMKAIEKMKFLPTEPNDPTVVFNFPVPDPLPSPVITCDKVSLGYGEKVVLKDISVSIMSDDRIAIVGANGNGKTTFAKFLAGSLKPKKGTRNAIEKLKVGFYRQDLFEELNVDNSPYDYIKSILQGTDHSIKAHLGRFGFSGDKATQKIKDLSGGEKARLVFAGLTINAPNLLILDEPTNHLDLEMRESLISTLTDYQGCVILITHDRHFLNRVANSIFVVEGGKITSFSGDLSDYEKRVDRNR